MNIHHLELFYYVARHGGIAEGVRNIPYGIQQPAVSAQIIQLEAFLGHTLFQRRPFSLTPQGRELYDFIKPFFENLTSMADRLRGGIAQHVRVAASETVIRDHLPSIFQELGKPFPKLKVTLREGYHPEVITWLQQQEIDLYIGLLDSRLPTGILSMPMFNMPLILLAPKRSKLSSASELWERDHIKETLITVPSNQLICRAFQNGLAKLEVDWFSGIEVSTVEMVQTYVAHGHGFGVTVRVPKMKYHPQVRPLLLDGFDLVTFGVLWQGQRTVVLDALFKLLEGAARKVMDGEDANLMLLK
jgi:DNA-binding transcriptional LysR family regulator